MPRARYGDLAAVAASRLKDKTAQVRKDALKLLVATLEHNPFAPVLDPAPHEKRADGLAAALVAGDAADALRDRASAEAVLARAAAEAEGGGGDDAPEPVVDEAAEEARAASRPSGENDLAPITSRGARAKSSPRPMLREARASRPKKVGRKPRSASLAERSAPAGRARGDPGGARAYPPSGNLYGAFWSVYRRCVSTRGRRAERSVVATR